MGVHECEFLSHGPHSTHENQPPFLHSFTKSIYSQSAQPRSSTNKHTDNDIFFSPLNGGHPFNVQTRIRFKAAVLFTAHLTQMEKGLKFTFPLECILFILSGHLHENRTVRIDSVAPLLCSKNVSFLEHKKGSGLHTLGNKPSSGLKLSLLITDQAMARSAVAKTQMLFLR